MLNPRN